MLYVYKVKQAVQTLDGTQILFFFVELSFELNYSSSRAYYTQLCNRKIFQREITYALSSNGLMCLHRCQETR